MAGKTKDSKHFLQNIRKYITMLLNDIFLSKTNLTCIDANIKSTGTYLLSIKVNEHHTD